MSINKIENRINTQNINSIQNNNDFVEYIDCEMNGFSYKETAENGKRSFFNYFISLIKAKHWIIFYFYSNIGFNPLIIKIFLFSFSFPLYYTINTLFFDDSSIKFIFIT